MLLLRSNNLNYIELRLIIQTHIQITAIFTHPADWYLYTISIRTLIIAKIMKEACSAGIGSVMLNVR